MNVMAQRTPEWFAIRAGKFTGSRFSDLMAVTKTGPSASRRNLIATLACERMTGQCVDTYTNTAMQRGVELEAEARAAYESHVGELVMDEAFIQHPTLEWVGVSVDGLVSHDGLVELKCPSAMARHMDALLSSDHVREYYWQIQGQMWVTGRSWCDAVSFDPRWPEPFRLAVQRVLRDEPAIAKLETECIKAEQEVQISIARLKASLKIPEAA